MDLKSRWEVCKMEYPQTKIKVAIRTELNLGDYNRYEIEIGLEDWKRDSDDTTGAAIERVLKLIESKLEAKLKDIK